MLILLSLSQNGLLRRQRVDDLVQVKGKTYTKKMSSQRNFIDRSKLSKVSDSLVQWLYPNTLVLLGLNFFIGKGKNSSDLA